MVKRAFGFRRPGNIGARFLLLRLNPLGVILLFFLWPLILWSLEFGVGVFYEFLLINFVGDELMQGQTLTSQQVS